MKKENVLIGWGQRDVTPEKRAFLRGQFYVRISEKVHDPLSVTVLAIEGCDSKEQTMIASLDAVSISDEVLNSCREILTEKLPDFNADKFFISATHSHTAPEQPSKNAWPYPPGLPKDVLTPAEYGDLLSEKISEAAIEAWNSRKPGAISWGKGSAVIGYNRRVSYFDGSTTMYGNTADPEFSHIEGYEDHSVNLLFTYDEQHSLTGMIVNVPCPSQCTESARFISADYWHETRVEIRKRHGENIFILPQCSAAGDQSPRPMVDRPAEARMLQLKGYGDDYNYARRQDIADKIALAVDEVLPLVAKDIRDQLELGHKVNHLELPQRKVSDDDLKIAKEAVAQNKEKLAAMTGEDPTSVKYSSTFRRIAFNQRVLDMHQSQLAGNDTLPIEIHTLRLGDTAMCTNRFEYYLDFGERIKARSKALQTFVVQLAGAGTYLPTERSMRGGSYGAYIASTPIGPEGGQMIVEHSVAEINRQFA